MIGPPENVGDDNTEAGNSLILLTMRPSLTFHALGVLAFASLGACGTDTFTSDGGTDGGDDGIVVTGGDGGTDGSVKDAVSEQRFCETNASALDASFCADFDIPNDAGAGFTVLQTGTYTYRFESSDVQSAPNALEVDVPDGGVSTGGSAFLVAPIGVDGGASSTATLDFEVIIPDITAGTSPLFIFSFGEITGSVGTQFGLEHDSAWSLSNLEGNRKGTFNTSTIPTGVWTHVTLTIVLSTALSQGSVNIAIGGSTATANIPMVETVGTNGVGPPAPWAMSLQLGASCGQATSAVSAFFDNVIVHLQ